LLNNYTFKRFKAKTFFCLKKFECIVIKYIEIILVYNDVGLNSKVHTFWQCYKEER